MKNKKIFKITKAFYGVFKKNNNLKKSQIIWGSVKNAPMLNKIFLRALSLMFVIFTLLSQSLSMSFLRDKPRLPSIAPEEPQTIDILIKKQLTRAADSIFCAMKSYPRQFDNIGINGADVIEFKNQMAIFIENQFGIRSDVLAKGMLNGSENLYRFLADRKNNMGLKQCRKLNKISEKDLFYFQKMNNILIDYFRTYKTIDMSDNLTDDSPEITVISATLYCFATDDDLKNPDLFIDRIMVKSNAGYSLKKKFIRNIKDILNIDTVRDKKKSEEKLSLRYRIGTKIVRVLIVGEDETNEAETIKYLYSVADNKKIHMQCLMAGGNTIHRASNVHLDECPDVDFTVDFTTISDSNLCERLNRSSKHNQIFLADYYDVFAFALDENKCSNDDYIKLRKKINRIIEDLIYLEARRPAIFVLGKNNQSIYQDICKAALTIER